MNPSPIPEWISVLAPFIAGGAGVGMTYGILRQSIENLKEKVVRLEAVIDHQVGDIRCAQMRTDCRTDLKGDFEDVKSELRSQRKVLDEVNRFMGRVNGGPR